MRYTRIAHEKGSGYERIAHEKGPGYEAKFTLLHPGCQDSVQAFYS